uniref:Uncharacterized protein n=1 Tax=Cyprinus carpio TaxID=7962 RepID=A0A8C1PE23_CYPCA
MDISTAVFNAARDGKLKLIQKLLSNKSPEELEALAEEKTQGGTPLLIASRYGHLEVVEYLLEHCKAGVELGGAVSFDGETIEGAPPLWAASAAGHLPVVKTLLKHGASVNSTTLTNSTPLRAACFDGHLEIVRGQPARSHLPDDLLLQGPQGDRPVPAGARGRRQPAEREGQHRSARLRRVRQPGDHEDAAEGRREDGAGRIRCACRRC